MRYRLNSPASPLFTQLSIQHDSHANQRKHQRSPTLAFVRKIHRWPVNFPHKWPVTWKMFPFDDVIMSTIGLVLYLSMGYLLWHYSDDTWASWHLKHGQLDCLFNSLTTKEASKFCIIGPLWGKSTNGRWIPCTKGQQCGNRLPSHHGRFCREKDYVITQLNYNKATSNQGKKGNQFHQSKQLPIKEKMSSISPNYMTFNSDAEINQALTCPTWDHILIKFWPTFIKQNKIHSEINSVWINSHCHKNHKNHEVT